MRVLSALMLSFPGFPAACLVFNYGRRPRAGPIKNLGRLAVEVQNLIPHASQQAT